MSWNTYKPNERLVDRACEIWVQLLERPKYDNLGPDSPEPLQSRVSNTMAAMITAQLPKNNTPDVLKRFAAELKKILMAPHKYTIQYNGKVEEHEQMFSHTHVDYGPDVPLSDAAKAAGLDMQFPWKTSVYIEADYVHVSNGYGDAGKNHYPLTQGRWLVTDLRGYDDMAKIIAMVEQGVLGLDLSPLPPSTR